MAGGEGSAHGRARQRSLGLVRRFPQVAVVLELHLWRDPPQTVNLLHQIERTGYLLRAINYEGEVVPADAATILGQPQEHWTLWIRP